MLVFISISTVLCVYRLIRHSRIPSILTPMSNFLNSRSRNERVTYSTGTGEEHELQSLTRVIRNHQATWNAGNDYVVLKPVSSRQRSFNDQEGQGSAAYLPDLIHEIECIFTDQSTGRKVYRGRLNGEEVAVKIFPINHPLRSQELEIWQSLPIHENLIRFVGMKFLLYKNQRVEPNVLTTPFYSPGSLQHYLVQNCLSIESLLLIATSIASGLDALHSQGVAHRDLTSSNILIENRNRKINCVINGFSKAFKNGFPKNDLLTISNIRYLPPEFLVEGADQGSCTLNDFMMADVYAFGLILWELLSRTAVQEYQVGTYMRPYSEIVPDDQLNIHRMRWSVVQQAQRPQVHEDWFKNKITHEMVQIMTSCWLQEKNSRPTIRDITYILKSHT